MENHSLHTLSPVDGRYAAITRPLEDYFSEFALMRYRLRVEVEYFIALTDLPIPLLSGISKEKLEMMRSWVETFSDEDASRIKEIEHKTNHDVKAIEYFLQEKFAETGLEKTTGFIHFALTSQDINNTAFPLMIYDAYSKVYLPALEKLITRLQRMATAWKSVPMLAHTHGQPASPTTMGKEMLVFVKRLEGERNLSASLPRSAKFGGATGNFNAHKVAFPNIDWVSFADHFVNDILHLQRIPVTTQIDPYDHLAAWMHHLIRTHTILLDLSRDCWSYISMEYFKQKIHKDEVGSSTMPHKVNPIDFENAEGNLGLANALLSHMAEKLPVSRLQRDLSDSTVLRNTGIPVAHALVAFASLAKGLDKLVLNEEQLNRDLDNHWSVVAEAIQTILRREGYPDPYEALKALTRTNQPVTRASLSRFIDGLALPEKVKKELKAITPHNYTGESPFFS